MHNVPPELSAPHLWPPPIMRPVSTPSHTFPSLPLWRSHSSGDLQRSNYQELTPTTPMEAFLPISQLHHVSEWYSFLPQFLFCSSIVLLSTTILQHELSSQHFSLLEASVFPTIGISTLRTDAIPHHCCRLHSYIKINDCTSIPVFTVLQHPNYHYSEYKQETCVCTFPSHFPSYVSNGPLCPHILPYIGAGAQYLIPQNSHSYCSQCSSSFGTGPHLVPTGKITFCPTRSKYLSSCNSKFVDT